MKCSKHQWEYVDNFSIGKEEIVMYNPRYAKFVCPCCEEIKLVKIKEGVEKL